MFSAFQAFFQRGSENEFLTLVPDTLKLPAICHCVERQALHLSQQQGDEPQGVKPHAGRKPGPNTRQPDTTRAIQANAADQVREILTDGSAAQGKKRRISTANGPLAKARTFRERALEETIPEPTHAVEVRKQPFGGKSAYSAEQRKNLRYIVTGLTKLETLPLEDLQRIWADEEFSGIAPDMEYTARAAFMLQKNLHLTKDGKLPNRYKQRFVILFYGHEIDQIIRTERHTGERGRDGKSIAFDKVARVHNMERNDLIKMYQQANIYLQCAKSGGAGTLLSMKNLIS